MKRSLILCAMFALYCQAASGATKADSILAVTDGARAKLVWVRWPWCDSGYNPMKNYLAADIGQDGLNDHQLTQLMCFDTYEGSYQYIDTTIGFHDFPRITAKSGAYVIWNDETNTCSWIRDIARTAPKRKLIAGGDWWVLACQYNPVTDSEYVYVFTGYGTFNGVWSDQEGTGVARIPIRDDGTLDLTQKKTVLTPTSSEKGLENTVNVSQDGKYLGCNLPIPNCTMVEISTGKRIPRHDPGADFGCQTNLAPDNSYRFFHLTDSHVEIAMYDAGTAATVNMWHVNIATALPGNLNRDGGVNDVAAPRWSNNVRFFTAAYPLTSGIMNDNNNAGIFGQTPDWIKAQDPARFGSFCLAKFNAGFTAVEKAVRVTNGDIRNHEEVGDAWIAPSPSGEIRAPGMRLLRHGDVVTVGSGEQRRSSVGLFDMRGRTVRRSTGSGAITIGAGSLDAGVYLLSTAGRGAERVTIAE